MMSDLPHYSKITRTLPIRDKVGQLFMPAAFINDTEENVQILESTIREYKIGGLCFFHSRASAATNFEGEQEIPYNKDSLKRLRDLIERYQRAAEYPLLIAMDAEWGLAMRVENSPQYPYALTLGAMQRSDESLLYELGLCMAEDCRKAGIHWNLSPVVDININPENPVIGYRAFGNQPETVQRKALQVFRGLRDGGILTCLKHYPGHGDTAVDSHLALPVLNKDLDHLEALELKPFRALIEEGAPAVMPGHLSLPQLDPSGLPASLSKKIIKILRDQLGFGGVVVTDALNMHALHSVMEKSEDLNAMALEAGNDLLCFASEIPASIERIIQRIPPKRLEASFRRVWDLKEQALLKENKPVRPSLQTESLNQKLAECCLSELGPTRESLKKFRSEGFQIVYYGEQPDAFLNEIRSSQDVAAYEWLPGRSFTDIIHSEQSHVVLALVPPSMKPTANFGLSERFFNEIQDFSERNNVLLYLFGNPYLLRQLPLYALRGVVCAFQPLKAFQQAAGKHLLGETNAKGILPIQLEDYD